MLFVYMPHTFPFTEESLEQTVVQCIDKVFEVMLYQTTHLKRICSNAEIHAEPKILLNTLHQDVLLAGSVGFTGSILVLIHIYLTEKLSRKLTSQMLNMSQEEVLSQGLEIIHDTLREISNMVIGNIKSALLKTNVGTSRITVPTVAHSSKVSTSTQSTAHTLKKRFIFEAEQTPFIVDFLIKPNQNQAKKL